MAACAEIGADFGETREALEADRGIVLITGIAAVNLTLCADSLLVDLKGGIAAGTSSEGREHEVGSADCTVQSRCIEAVQTSADITGFTHAVGADGEPSRTDTESVVEGCGGVGASVALVHIARNTGSTTLSEAEFAFA